MEPAFVALCEKYVYNKKICRDCYATNPAKAKTCRKRKCGRSGQLRMKKVAKKWLINYNYIMENIDSKFKLGIEEFVS